jgi:hypothetical protein
MSGSCPCYIYTIRGEGKEFRLILTLFWVVVQFELETAELLYSAIDFPQAKKQNNEPRQAGVMFCWRVYQNAQAHEGKYKPPSDA